jgi:pimeloyl-ACP methyl ester carboxylesterase
MSIAVWAEHHDPRTRARAAALINTGLGDLLSSHLLLPQIARFLNHPWASRAVLGSHAPVPPFSTPLQQAMIRYTAFGPSASMGDVAFYERMLIDTPPDARAAVGVALSSMDLWHAVASITVPTLVITGDSDRLTPPAAAHRIAEALPYPAGLLELPETGHMSPLERPREVSEALERLIRDTASARVASADER